MSAFDSFLDAAWSQHGSAPESVAGSLTEAVALITEPAQLVPFAQLATHVYGEHLGQWSQGIEFLNRLRPLVGANAGSRAALDRSVASLSWASGAQTPLESFSASDQARILATAASALAGRGDTVRATAGFQQALSLMTALAAGDPAFRALAITGNNLAATFEERSTLTLEQAQLMLLAARTARKYWEIAGGWMEVERAEYRLAMSCLKAGLTDQAVVHARNCVEICRKNGADASELGYAEECLALAEKSAGPRSQ